MTAAIAIFALTSPAVAGGRLPGLSLDRPAAALLGAVLMVAAGFLAGLPLARTALVSSTLAGNLTVVGSVANLIVLELAGPLARVGFWGFVRHGAVVTVATLTVALAILLGERAVGMI